MDQELYRVQIIKLWNNILVPLMGEINDQLARRLNEDVLQRIHETGAAGLVIDVTGVWMMDSHLCSVLSRLAEAAGLIGTRTVISGLTPDIAITLQMMGAELRGAHTALTLEEALESLGVYTTAARDTVWSTTNGPVTPPHSPRVLPMPPGIPDMSLTSHSSSISNTSSIACMIEGAQ
jgi:rsbT antagonist protein RsbS